MRTVSSSRRWGKVKRRKPQFKLEQNKDQAENQEDKDDSHHRRRVPRHVKKSWAERHPALLIMSTAVGGIAILAAIIYLIPKSASPAYDDEQRKQQPTLSHLKNDDKTGGPRAAPTDQSFLDTHYRRDSASASGMAPGSAGGNSGNSSSGKSTSNAPNTSFGDGTVSRKDGNCQVSATGSGSFAGALADCVKSSSSGPAK